MTKTDSGASVPLDADASDTPGADAAHAPFEPRQFPEGTEPTHEQIHQLLHGPAHLELTDAEQYNVDTFQVERFAQGPQIESVILPNDQMSFEKTEELRLAGGHDFAVIYDTNPKGCFTKDMLAEKRRMFPRVLLFDHHGPSSVPKPVGEELTATEILLEQVGKPQSAIAQILRAGDKVKLLTVTNQGNFDPDGILSRAIIQKPGFALRHKETLVQIARYTDYAFFGGERFDGNFRPEMAPPYKKMAWSILQLIIEEQEKLVESATGVPIYAFDRSDETRALVRSVYGGADKKYTPESLNRMFDNINDEVRSMLMRPEAYLQERGPQRWMKYAERLKKVSAYADSKEFLSTDSSGFLATFAPTDRPDKEYVIYDWLACGAGSSGLKTPEVPLFFSRDRNGQVVISVPYATQRDDKKFIYDLTPVFQELNTIEPSNWGGRDVVAFNFGKTAIPKEKIQEIVLRLRDKIVRPRG